MSRPLRSACIALCAALLAAPGFARAEASEDIKSAIAAARVDYQRARKAIDTRDWPEAIRALESALRHDPQDAEFHNLLGYSYRHAGNMDAAFKHYFMALDLNPWHRGAHEYLGRAYLMVDKPEKAMEQLKALEGSCPEGCRERELLTQAIRDYPWPPAARMTRAY